MAKAPSQDLRSRVIAAVEGGVSRQAAAAAARFGVSASSAVRWVAAWRAHGQAAAKRQGGDRRPRRIEAYGGTILAAVEARVDITPEELAAPPRERHGVRFAPSGVWRFLDRPAMTTKKTAHAAERARPDVAARRAARRAARADLDPAKPAFVDETGASTKMARTRRRSRRGTRRVAPVPHGHRKTTTFVRRRAARRRPDRADGARRADEWPGL
jgi:transposase